MVGFSRGQGVPLHRGLHQPGSSTNPNKCFIDQLHLRAQAS